ncbi:MAG: HAD family phosphatase [Candidatus Micrarchaeota archaeon]|nr:HAD family phosphatase [Candidatus Micrarchaeota archaeon]
MMKSATKKINTAFIDIDGTIFDSKSYYNPDLKGVIGGMINEGFTIGLLTNRSLKSSLRVYQELNLNGLIVFEDGAAIYSPNKQKRINLVNNLTNLNAAQSIIKEAITSGKLLHEMKREDLVFKINDEKEYSISVHLRTAQGTRCDELIAQAVPAVESLLSNYTNLITYDTGRGNFLVRYVNSGKGTGIDYLVKRNMIKGDETIIIGDGDNDVPAFRAVQLNGGMAGVVENATPRAKAFADILSENAYSDGVIEILNKIKMLNQIRRI